MRPRPEPEKNHRVPHIPDFLWSSRGSAHSMRLSFKERRTRGIIQRSEQEIRGISLVFREMWDTANLNPFGDEPRAVTQAIVPSSPTTGS